MGCPFTGSGGNYRNAAALARKGMILKFSEWVKAD
jgi:hypothetical protein